MRTALSDTCSLSPVLPPSAVSSHPAFSVPRSSSRSSAEIAAPSLVSEDANRRRNAGPESRDFPQPTEDDARGSETTCQTIVTSSNEDTVNAMGIESKDKMKNQRTSVGLAMIRPDISSTSKDYPVLFNRKKANIVDDEVKLIEEKIDTRHLLTINSSLSEEQTGGDHQDLRGKCAQMTSEKDEARILVSASALEEQKDSPSEVESSINHPNSQKACTFRTQRGSLKKPPRRRNNLRRSFSEADKNPRQDTKIDTSPSSCSSTTDTIIGGASRNTVSEDEGCCSRDDDHRDIIEVPDVAVVCGGSIMPTNLCSTRTPISRTQRAPSRATYTTAYI